MPGSHFSNSAREVPSPPSFAALAEFESAKVLKGSWRAVSNCPSFQLASLTTRSNNFRCSRGFCRSNSRQATLVKRIMLNPVWSENSNRPASRPSNSHICVRVRRSAWRPETGRPIHQASSRACTARFPTSSTGKVDSRDCRCLEWNIARHSRSSICRAWRIHHGGCCHWPLSPR